ncbi:MAG: hypothetical protein M8467_19780, partial [Anaerolineae bacterium]|nr:hypothetical protein [Anaerolineae bacterium]
MVDFLGLLQPEVAEALARRDLYWALLRYQPDYLALTAVAPLYAYDLRADPWFQAAYTPAQSFQDPRFWGSPVTIYQRQIARTTLVEDAPGTLPAKAMTLDVGVGSAIRLVGALTEDTSIHPGEALQITLYWEALEPVDTNYKVFVHLLGQYDRVIAQRDAVPGLGARPTSEWERGQVIADPHLLALPEAAYAPDTAVWEVGLYDGESGSRLPVGDGTDNVRFGSVAVLPRAEPLRLDFGRVVLAGYEVDRLALQPGEPLHLSLDWSGGGRATVTVQLVHEGGEVAAQVTGGPETQEYALSLPADAKVGAYDLRLVLVDPVTGVTLP